MSANPVLKHKRQAVPLVEDALRYAANAESNGPECFLCLSDDKHRQHYGNQITAELNLIALAREIKRLRGEL